MEVTTQMVKELREKTGAGIMDAKRALEQANGNMVEATNILRQQGLDRAVKKAGRAATDGLVWAYIHGGQPGQSGGRIGALIELNCETDFVARTDDFRNLARDIAMQVAASDPQYITADDILENEFARVEAEGGDRQKFVEQVALLSQPFIKDPRRSIEDVIKEQIGKLGENIVVRRFCRFELGAGVDSDEEQG